MEDKWVVISDNLITNNSAISDLWPKGGGMAIAYCNTRIVRNRVESNTVSAYSSTYVAAAGGVWYSCDIGFQDSVVIKDNIIKDNLVEQLTANNNGTMGAGLTIVGAYGQTVRAVVRNNQISGNEIHAITSAYGNGVCIMNCNSIKFSHNRIYDNSFDASYCYGGGLCIWNNHPEVSRNLIFNNTATKGGGIYVGYQETSEPELFNNVIYGNTATESGTGIYLKDAKATIKNSIIWNNLPAGIPTIFVDAVFNQNIVEYNCINESFSGQGNITEDPLLVDPFYGDFSIASESPCIDAGDPAYQCDPDLTICDQGVFYYDYVTRFDIPGDVPKIQDGINIATDGDTVVVDEGTYYENINFLGKTIIVCSNYLFEKDRTIIENTVIDGSQPENPDMGSVVSFVSGETHTSVLKGFTITGGTGTYLPPGPANPPIRMGGGILCLMSGPKIIDNIIAGNSLVIPFGLGTGGGIISGPPGTPCSVWIEGNTIENNTVNSMIQPSGAGILTYGPAEIHNNVISENICYSETDQAGGGGIACIGFFGPIDVNISDNTIVGNQAISVNSTMTHYGGMAGGMVLFRANGSAVNNYIGYNSIKSAEGDTCTSAGVLIEMTDDLLFKDNIVANNGFEGGLCFGGGMGVWYGGAELVNNLVYGHAAHYGGGICLIDTAASPLTSSVINNTFADNRALQDGASLYISGSNAIVMNAILWSEEGFSGNEIVEEDADLSVVYSDIRGGATGEGNINIEPMFAIDDSLCHISGGSPCQNSGIESIEVGGITYLCPDDDYEGDPRPDPFGGPDMGADEHFYVGEAGLQASSYKLQAFPNPSYGISDIRYQISDVGFVLLEVFDVRGKKICTLVNEFQDSGEYHIPFSGIDLPAGLYIFRLKVNGSISTEKLLLM